MLDWGLLAVAGGAVLAALACTVLPGLALKFVALQRLRGRRVESPTVLGPLVGYELTRLARRGLHPRLRAVYAAVLLVGLLVTYLAEFEDRNPIDLLTGKAYLPLDRTSEFAGAFFRTFAFCQLATLTLLTPVFAGGALTEEKDRRTIDHLRASLLSNRELVVGKLAAPLLYVLGVALAGLPVLALTMHFGGVPGEQLVAAFAAAFVSTLSLAAFSLWLATRRDTLREVLFYAYSAAVVLPLSGCCCACVGLPPFVSPFVFTGWLLNQSAGREVVITAAVFVLVHGVWAFGFTLLAMGGIRTAGVPRRRPPGEPALAVPLEPPRLPPKTRYVEAPPRERPRFRGFFVPRLHTSDPFLWKELYFSTRLPTAEAQTARAVVGGIAAVFAVSVGLALFVALFKAVDAGGSPAEVLNPVLRVVAVAAAVALAPLAGVRTALSVGRERQQQTLDSLFALPVERAVILRAKWRAALLWAKPWLFALAGVAVVAAVTGSVHPAGLAVAAALLAGYLPFALSFGLWLSVRCRTVLRAMTVYLLALIALSVVPLMLGTLVRAAAAAAVGTGSGEAIEAMFRSVSVPYAAWRAGELEGAGALPLLTGAAAAAMYAAAAWLFWRDARRRFEEEGR